jgi:glycosyltransferase involved in cell wall biosynthesis
MTAENPEPTSTGGVPHVLSPESEQVLVSIIIPTFNRVHYIEETLVSVLAQTYRPLECVIVDDGSTDGTEAFLEDWCHSHNGVLGLSFRYKQQEHRGAPAARNLGFATSTGAYIQFLDSDDLLDSRKIEIQMAAGRKHADALLCGPWQRFRVLGGQEVFELPAVVPDVSKDLISQSLRGLYFTPHSVLWPRSLVSALGPWDETLTSNQDGDYFLRAALSGVEVVFVPDAWAYYRAPEVGQVTVGTDKRSRHSLASRVAVLEKLMATLEHQGRLGQYRDDIAYAFYELARAYAVGLAREAAQCVQRYKELSSDPRFPGSWANHWGTVLLGISRKERLAHWMAGFRGRQQSVGSDCGKCGSTNHSRLRPI